MSSVLEIRGLAKQYRITGKDHFWALKDLNLDLKEGEVLGLIGHNGAGKSTLLKILSRITAPSQGEVRARGRIASLLEVGTGFHPDLSGRDNIFLNGSILGMKRAEIKARFDEIVAFAGVERFLDMPVKRYSSGMYVRLAFSVAAHLDADILLIDEVLAVGDVDFQRKCLQRMENISREQDRSIIFVSHNLNAIQSLCDRVTLLEQGNIKLTDKPELVIQEYRSSLERLQKGVVPAERKDREGDGRAKLLEISMQSPGNAIRGSFPNYEDLEVHIKMALHDSQARQLRVVMQLYNSAGNYLSSLQTEQSLKGNSEIELKAMIPNIPLMAGNFFWNCHIFLDGIRADFLGRAHYFEIREDQFHPDEIAQIHRKPGFYLPHQWL